MSLEMCHSTIAHDIFYYLKIYPGRHTQFMPSMGEPLSVMNTVCTWVQSQGTEGIYLPLGGEIIPPRPPAMGAENKTLQNTCEKVSDCFRLRCNIELHSPRIGDGKVELVKKAF